MKTCLPRTCVQSLIYWCDESRISPLSTKILTRNCSSNNIACRGNLILSIMSVTSVEINVYKWCVVD